MLNYLLSWYKIYIRCLPSESEEDLSLVLILRGTYRNKYLDIASGENINEGISPATDTT